MPMFLPGRCIMILHWPWQTVIFIILPVAGYWMLKTGGMALGTVATGYKTDFKLLGYQKKSFQGVKEDIFNRLSSMEIPPSFEEILPLIISAFGLGPGDVNFDLSSMEMDMLETAYGKSVNYIKERGDFISHEKNSSIPNKFNIPIRTEKNVLLPMKKLLFFMAGKIH